MKLLHQRTGCAPVLCLTTLLTLSLLVAAPAAAQSLLFNGSLNLGPAAWPRLSPGEVQHLRSNGWNCPDGAQWPSWWLAKGSNVRFEVVAEGGKLGQYARITGKEGAVICRAYSFKDWDKQIKEEEKHNFGEDHLFSVWTRGKGVLRVSFEAFGESAEGKSTSVASPRPFTVNVDSDTWVCYRHIIRQDAAITRIHPEVSTVTGTLDFDELSLWRARFAEVPLVEEQERLYGTGALIEDKEMVAADDTFFATTRSFKSALEAFASTRESINRQLAESLDDTIHALFPYALTEGITTVQVIRYNDLIALTRVLNRLVGHDVGEAAAISAVDAQTTPV